VSRGVVAALTRAGMREEAAAERARLFARAGAALDAAGPRTAPHRYFVPGRIEMLGKHTDYAGGHTLVCAVEHGISAVFAGRDDDEIHIVDAVSGEMVSFVLDPDLLPASGGAWSNYPMTVARRLARNFPRARRGADIAFASDLPPASGLSSSSALMIAIYLALAAVNEIAADAGYQREIHNPLDLAGYLATVENGQDFGTLGGDRGVGTFGGSEDHAAILCGRPGFISQYAFCPARHERDVPLPRGYAILVATSGVAAEKTGAARDTYNRASLAAQKIVELWRMATGAPVLSLAAAVQSAPGAVEEIRRVIGASRDNRFPLRVLLARFEHFVEENEVIVPSAGDALEQGAIDRLGELVDRSQTAAERLLGNQIPETIALARSARALGARAASAFGAGFGGSVWALVDRDEARAFGEEWLARYRSQFQHGGARATCFVTHAGPSALRV
jgi:galactokinase